MTMLSLVFFAALAQHVEATSCPEKCKCWNKSVNCGSKGITDAELLNMTFPYGNTELWLIFNKLTRFPPEILQNTTFTSVNLMGNQIKEIPQFAAPLKRVNLESNQISGKLLAQNLSSWCQGLISINLKSNRITGIEDEAFKSCSNLTILQLGTNEINAINRQTFSKLHKLKYLYSGLNPIGNISAGTFDETPNLTHILLPMIGLTEIKANVFTGLPLEDLSLNKNEITKIEKGSFNGNKIEQLNLQDNQLKTIDAEWFTKRSSAEINVFSNPIACSCEMLQNIQQMTNNSVFGNCQNSWRDYRMTTQSLQNMVKTPQEKCNKCLFVDCHNEGECKKDTSDESTFKCQCKPGFKGKACEDKDPCFEYDENKCSNGGNLTPSFFAVFVAGILFNRMV